MTQSDSDSDSDISDPDPQTKGGSKKSKSSWFFTGGGAGNYIPMTQTKNNALLLLCVGLVVQLIAPVVYFCLDFPA